MNASNVNPASHWRVTMRPAENIKESHANARLAAQIRPALAAHLRSSPNSRRFVTPISPLHEVEMVLMRGTPTPEDLGTLDLATAPPPIKNDPNAFDVPVSLFPDPNVRRLAGELVGLEDIAQDIHTDLACRYDGRLDAWSRATACFVPEALRSLLEGGAAIYLLEGPPGTGKTSLAKVILDARCRAMGVDGYLLTLNTKARGNGLVGNFSQNIHAAFAQLRALPEGSVRGLLIDEVEAIAVRRSREQTHIEDVAGCASLLQSFDDLMGEPGIVIFLTTNQASAIDPALRRRCAATFTFKRPGPEARRALLLQWVPDFSEESFHQMVQASEEMTPADINASLTSVFRAAVSADAPVVPEAVHAALSRWHRTEEV